MEEKLERQEWSWFCHPSGVQRLYRRCRVFSKLRERCNKYTKMSFQYETTRDISSSHYRIPPHVFYSYPAIISISSSPWGLEDVLLTREQAWYQLGLLYGTPYDISSTAFSPWWALRPLADPVHVLSIGIKHSTTNPESERPTTLPPWSVSLLPAVRSW